MINNQLRLPCAFTCLVLASLLCGQAAAADFRITGFGTLGYAESDQDFRYLRYIDKGGTFKADSLIGVQAEAEFNPQWSATLQAVASPSQGREEGYEARVRWAFLSYRPTNDWLLRAGRLRPQTFLHTQNSEVGVTYDQARLPAELYTLTPNYDFDGAAFTKTWDLGKAELGPASCRDGTGGTDQ